MAEQRVHDLGARHEHIDEVKSSVSASKKWNLRGGRPTHPNLLSKREMDSLTAACDAFLPSVDVSDTGDEGLIAFYGTSASMAGTPERIGGLLSGGMQHPAIGLLRLALWLLSTWYGTFILCGRASLSNQFPYLQKFPQVRREMQEEILLSWSRSSLRPLKMLYKCLKYLTMKEYFSQVASVPGFALLLVGWSKTKILCPNSTHHTINLGRVCSAPATIFRTLSW